MTANPPGSNEPEASQSELEAAVDSALERKLSVYLEESELRRRTDRIGRRADWALGVSIASALVLAVALVYSVNRLQAQHSQLAAGLNKSEEQAVSDRVRNLEQQLSQNQESIQTIQARLTELANSVESNESALNRIADSLSEVSVRNSSSQPAPLSGSDGSAREQPSESESNDSSSTDTNAAPTDGQDSTAEGSSDNETAGDAEAAADGTATDGGSPGTDNETP